jgi:hypothetical protein
MLMRLFKRLIDDLLEDTRAMTAFAGTPVPERVRAPLAQLLWDLVEEGLAEEEFWRRWSALPLERGETLAPMEWLLQFYLRLRQDPYAGSYSIGELGPRPAPQFQRCRTFLREQIARLGKPERPSPAHLSIPATESAISPEGLPIPTPARLDTDE